MMDRSGNASGPGPPPPPPPESSPALGFVIMALGGLIIALSIVLVVVLLNRGDGSAAATSPTAAPSTAASPITEAVTSLPPATTITTATEAPAITTTTTQPATVVLPDSGSIYNQPVADAVARLAAAGLNVDTAVIGCSNSTNPGMVRRVTVGSEPNARIIYGKPTDTLDPTAAAALAPGDAVTVWTPSANPCP